MDTAALTEPLAVAVHAFRRSSVTPESSVLVLGGGPIGMSVTAILLHNHVKKITCSCKYEHQRLALQRLFQAFGATECRAAMVGEVDSADCSFDTVFECVVCMACGCALLGLV